MERKKEAPQWNEIGLRGTLESTREESNGEGLSVGFEGWQLGLAELWREGDHEENEKRERERRESERGEDS